MKVWRGAGVTGAARLLFRECDPLPCRNISELVRQISEGDAPAFLFGFNLLGDPVQAFCRYVLWPASFARYRMKRALPCAECVEIGSVSCNRADREFLTGR